MSSAPLLRYTRVAAWLHWLMAAMILFNLVSGVSDSAIGSIRTHKAMGITILGLAIVRLAWRLTHRIPPLPQSIPALQRRAAHAMHWLLYALMIIMPLSGWLMVSNGETPKPLTWFGLFPIPYLRINPAVGEPADATHLILGYSMAVLLVGHIAAALWHQYRQRIPLIERLALGGTYQK
jgi:cytochrome b561